MYARAPQPNPDSGDRYYTDGENLYRFAGWLTRSDNAELALPEDCRSLELLLVTADDLARARLRPITGQGA
jgi:hypothetical protein